MMREHGYQQKENVPFYLGFNRYRNTIDHSEYSLSELDIQVSFSNFYGFFKRVVSISINYTFNFVFSFI